MKAFRFAAILLSLAMIANSLPQAVNAGDASVVMGNGLLHVTWTEQAITPPLALPFHPNMLYQKFIYRTRPTIIINHPFMTFGILAVAGSVVALALSDPVTVAHGVIAGVYLFAAQIIANHSFESIIDSITERDLAHIGTRSGRSYIPHLTIDHDHCVIKVQFSVITPDKHPQTTTFAGTITFKYDPAWPSLSISHIWIEPEYRSDGLYTHTLAIFISKLPPLTRIQHQIKGEPTTINLLYRIREIQAALRAMAGDQKTDAALIDLIYNRRGNPLSAAEEYTLVAAAFKYLVAANRTDELRLIDDSLRLRMGATPLSKPLVAAKVSPGDLHVTLDERGELALETVIKIDDFIAAVAGEEGTTVKYADVMLRAFIHVFIWQLGSAPPAEVIRDAYHALRLGLIEPDELFNFVARQRETQLDVVRKGTVQALQALVDLKKNPLTYTMTFRDFLTHHDYMSDLQTGKKPDLEGSPALRWVYHLEKYDSLTIDFIHSVIEFLSGDRIDNDVLLKTYIATRADLTYFIERINREEPVETSIVKQISDAYTVFRDGRETNQSRMKLSAPQAFWTQSLIRINNFGEAEVLKWLHNIRRERKERLKNVPRDRRIIEEKRYETLWEYMKSILDQHIDSFLNDPRMAFRLMGVFIGRGLPESQVLHRLLYLITQREEFFSSVKLALPNQQESDFEILLKRFPGLIPSEKWLLEKAFAHASRVAAVARQREVEGSA